MAPEDNRGIVFMDDGTATSFEGREIFTRLGSRPKTLSRLEVFLLDGTVRKLLGHSNVRFEKPYIWILLGNGFRSGIPILSEPIRTYDFETLKQEIRKRCYRDLPPGVARKEFNEIYNRATNFDEIFPLVGSLSYELDQSV